MGRKHMKQASPPMDTNDIPVEFPGLPRVSKPSPPLLTVNGKYTLELLHGHKRQHRMTTDSKPYPQDPHHLRSLSYHI
ncbi:hypothetical protein Bca4012_026967 [Brassica carinata]